MLPFYASGASIFWSLSRAYLCLYLLLDIYIELLVSIAGLLEGTTLYVRKKKITVPSLKRRVCSYVQTNQEVTISRTRKHRQYAFPPEPRGVSSAEPPPRPKHDCQDPSCRGLGSTTTELSHSFSFLNPDPPIADFYPTCFLSLLKIFLQSHLLLLCVCF